MAQLSTIYTRIKGFFNENNLMGEEDKFFFPLFAIGFTDEDFMFLHPDSATRDAKKYYHELLDFSKSANCIPRQDRYWQLSGENKDLLDKVYPDLINNLSLLDEDSLDITKLYGLPILDKLLERLGDNEEHEAYKSYCKLYTRSLREVDDLEKKGGNNAVEIGLKKDMLQSLLVKWETDGFKAAGDQKLSKIFLLENGDFIKKLNASKAKVAAESRNPEGGEFLITRCSPSGLYESNKLQWNKISMDKKGIKKLMDSGEEVLTDEFNEYSELEIEKINFELLQVNIQREWLDEDIILSTYWDWFLDKERIDIPYYATQFVMVRNIDIQLVKNSAKNTAAMKKIESRKNLGAFMIKKSLLKQNKLVLQSVNKAHKIDSKAFLKAPTNQTNTKKKSRAAFFKMNPTVISRITKPKARTQPMAVRTARTTKGVSATKPKPVKSKLHRTRTFAKPISRARFIPKVKLPTITAVNVIQTIQCNFFFRNADTKQQMEIEPKEIIIRVNNKVVKSKLVKNENLTLSVALAQQGKYKVEIKAEGVESKIENLEFSASEKQSKRAKRMIYLNLKETEVADEATENEFQLIAVICKKLPVLPQSIEGVEYL